MNEAWKIPGLIRGGGNVFEDLGYPDADAHLLKDQSL